MVFHRARQIWLALLCSLLVACGGGTAKKEHPPPIQPGEDPLYALQWHLSAINVAKVWGYYDEYACLGGDTGRRGEGMRIAIVDDGLEIRHPDLWPNWVPSGGLNFLTNGQDPTPGLIKDQQRDDPNDSHGTAVAGLAAARDCNSEGGRGVAPRAKVVGYNLLKQWSLSNEMTAMTHNHALVDVSNNSWGATDNTGQLQPAELTWRAAVEYGLEQGRDGRGTVYVWAAGNGGKDGIDNSNYDGRANFHGVMAIGAVERNGQKADYSEEGANLWLVAPGGNLQHDPHRCDISLVTTDLTGSAGLNNSAKPYDLDDLDYTRCMAGTSAATPLVSGVAALVLQARPELTWRDVRLVLAESARRDDHLANDWTRERPGHQRTIRHSHAYGFGLVDAEEAVSLASSDQWELLPPAQELYDTGLLPATEQEILISDSDIDFIEWVDIYFSSGHRQSGNLAITLISPDGTRSRLALPHLCHASKSNSWTTECTQAITGEDGIWSWRFGSARHLGEDAHGTWELQVIDEATGRNHVWQSWRLVIHGHNRRK